MRLIVPCTSPEAIKPGVLEALRADGLDPEIRLTPGPFGYYEMLAEVWPERLAEDLVLVEQDIVVRPGCIAEIVACGRDWCKFPYWYPPFGYYAGLGCTKFSGRLRRLSPSAMQIVGTMADQSHPPKHWCRLDAWLQHTLISDGEAEHYHHPPVEHLSDRADNRCQPGLRSHADIPA